jgi:hypothetical protein
VRLIGALAPRPPDGEADARGWAPARIAAEMLEKLALGRAVELRSTARRMDRNGLLHAQLYLSYGPERVWLQGRMLELGLARAYSFAEARECAAELIEREAEAREALRGIWALPAYEVRQASRPRELLSWRHSFQLVEGRVRLVQDYPGRTAILFGRGERGDFYASVQRADRRKVEVGGIELAALERRRVRVRGWIETWGGPYIRVTHAEQLEVLPERAREAHMRRRPYTRMGPPRPME